MRGPVQIGNIIITTITSHSVFDTDTFRLVRDKSFIWAENVSWLEIGRAITRAWAFGPMTAILTGFLMGRTLSSFLRSTIPSLASFLQKARIVGVGLLSCSTPSPKTISGEIFASFWTNLHINIRYTDQVCKINRVSL